jgi:hypothetical protein
MEQPTRQASSHEPHDEPLDDEERALMDPDNWDWDNPVEAIIAENPLAVFPIKVTMDEHRAIAQAARAKGLSTSAFIKQSAIDAARLTQIDVEVDAKAPHAATG